MNPAFPQFDPSSMDPKLMMQIAELVRQLPPDKISKMQTLMHNMMAGFDVRHEMEEFEKTLPPGFRDKLTGLMGQVGSMPVGTAGPPQSIREARITLLRAVADSRMTPEEAEKLLFPE